MENPAFAEHALVKTSTPFLYTKDSDILVRKGDALIYQRRPYEVISLNFKRREFHACPLWEGKIKNTSSEKNIALSINGFKRECAFAYIPQPNKEERKLLKTIHTEEFYHHVDKMLKEKHYHLHLVCATYNEYLPPIFYLGKDGNLVIKEERYYVYKNHNVIDNLNPFAPLQMAQIKAAAQKGIEVEYEWRLETYYDIFKDCIPELSALIAQAMPFDENNMAESA